MPSASASVVLGTTTSRCAAWRKRNSRCRRLLRALLSSASGQSIAAACARGVGPSTASFASNAAMRRSSGIVLRSASSRRGVPSNTIRIAACCAGARFVRATPVPIGRSAKRNASRVRSSLRARVREGSRSIVGRRRFDSGVVRAAVLCGRYTGPRRQRESAQSQCAVDLITYGAGHSPLNRYLGTEAESLMER